MGSNGRRISGAVTVFVISMKITALILYSMRVEVKVKLFSESFLIETIETRRERAI